MKNQCDGCNAGIPVVNGNHRMGREGGYPDLMGCTAKQYAEVVDATIIVPREMLRRAADILGSQGFSAWDGLADDIRGLLATPPLIQTLRENGDLIAAQATIANQAQMIEHLRGGLTTPTHIDVANADADGYRNGFAAAIKSLPEQQYFTNWAAYTEWRAAQIEAVGDFGGEVRS